MVPGSAAFAAYRLEPMEGLGLAVGSPSLPPAFGSGASFGMCGLRSTATSLQATAILLIDRGPCY